MRERNPVFLLLLVLSLPSVEGRSQIEHTYLPQCICPPYSIGGSVRLRVLTEDPFGGFFQDPLNVTLSIAGKPFDSQQITPNTGRIPLRIDAGLPYTTVTKIVNVAMGSDIGVLIQLYQYKPLAANISVDASSAFSLNIPRFSDPEALVMEFVENSFPVEDIIVWMSVWTTPSRDTPGSAGLRTVPGDFLAIDKDGRKQGLISEGVFSLLFTDAKNQTVTLAEGCKLRIRESVLLDISDTPSLYGLNKYTGFWEFNSNFVPLGNGILEANVHVSPDHDVTDFNIGYKWDTCVMKVNAIGGRFSGVQVFITQRFAGSDRWVYSNEGTANGDLCLLVRCCKPTNPTCGSLPKLYVSMYAILEGDIFYSSPTAENNGFSDELNAALEYEGGGGIRSVVEAYIGPFYPSIEQCKAGELYFQLLGF